MPFNENVIMEWTRDWGQLPKIGVSRDIKLQILALKKENSAVFVVSSENLSKFQSI